MTKRADTRLWTAEEDEKLRVWQKELGNRWSQIARHIPGRTGQQCAQRWRHRGNPDISRTKWTKKEDEQLAALVKEHGNAWADIARQLPGRTDQQVMGRWRRHLDPDIKSGPWEQWEDEALEELFAQYGPKWSFISIKLHNRTAQACRARYLQLGLSMTAAVDERSHDKQQQRTGKRQTRAPSRSTAEISSHDSDRRGQEAFPGKENYPVRSKRAKRAAENYKEDGENYCGPSTSGMEHQGQPLLDFGQIARPRSSFVPRKRRWNKAAVEAPMMAIQAIPLSLQEGSPELQRYANALFFWLQLILLQPLQPELSGEPIPLERVRLLAWLMAASFTVFCLPRSATAQRRMSSARQLVLQ